MGRKPNDYDEDKIISLYKKYGTIEDVRIRVGSSYGNVKKILEKNNIEIIKGVRSRKHLHFGRNLYGK